MKLMISQPMKNKTYEQIKKEREFIVKNLEEKGHEVVDTVFDDFSTKKATPLHYLAKSIEYLAEVDGVVFMPGWNQARGCTIEYQIASQYGKFIMLVE